MRTFLIIGAQKCGTTSLYRYLIQHPGVAPAVEKEIHYFTLHFSRGPEWYFAQLPGLRSPGDRQVTGEASPYYLFHPAVPRRVRALLPEARLIVLLRDPVARTISQYHHGVKRGFEYLRLDEALAMEAIRLQGESGRLASGELEYSFNHQHYSYVARSLYAEQLRRWLEWFPREQFLVLRSEDLFEAPAATYRRVLRFLDLPELKLAEYPKHYAGDYQRPVPEVESALRERFAGPNQELEELLGERFGWSPT